MTDQSGDPRRPDDELVTAVLDGEATPEERARVEADPVLSARLAEFAAVRDLVAGPVPPASETDRERAIAAAKVAVRHQPTVVPLAQRRRQELPRFLAVAAAVLLVLLAAGFLVSKVDTAGDDSGDSAAGSAEDSGGESTLEESGDSGADAPAEADDSAATNLDAAERAELGAVANQDQLLSALDRDTDAVVRSTGTPDAASSNVPVQPEVEATVGGDSEECQAGLDEVEPGLNGLLVQATADYAGTPAVVYVFGTTTGGQRVVVVSADGCRLLTVFDL